MANNQALHHDRELCQQWQEQHLREHAMVDQQLALARDDINRRLDEMNLLRHQIEEERGRYLLRDMYDREHGQLRYDMDNRLKVLETKSANLEGRMWAIGAFIGLGISVVMIILHFFPQARP